MSLDPRPELAPLRSVLEPAFADVATARLPATMLRPVTFDDTDTDADTIALHPVTGWVPTLPPDPHHCPDGICAEIADEAMALQLLITWRSRQAWAHAKKAEIRRIKTARGKKVKALRKQYAGAQS